MAKLPEKSTEREKRLAPRGAIVAPNRPEKSTEREKRLAEALRANLRRRKEQARARAEAQPPPSVPKPEKSGRG